MLDQNNELTKEERLIYILNSISKNTKENNKKEKYEELIKKLSKENKEKSIANEKKI